MNEYEKLREYVEGLEIVDTHEHLPANEEEYRFGADVLQEYLKHYYVFDLLSAGMPEEYLLTVNDENIPVGDKWRLIEPYWQAANNTGYAKCLSRAAKGLYGIEEISGDSIEELDRAYQRSKAGGFYRRMLKERCGIRKACLDTNTDFALMNFPAEYDRELFVISFNADALVMPKAEQHFAFLREFTGMDITTFEGYRNACMAAVSKAADMGAVAIKLGIAYQRTLHIGEPELLRAKTDFEDMMRNYERSGAVASGRALQDLLINDVIAIADERDLPVQFHTGLLEGSGALLRNSDPELLCPLFLKYPKVRFIVYHIGYPYYQTLGAYAKMFRNVYLDMCWSHVISQSAAINALVEWLDAVPKNKIFGFGGDYLFLDGIFGHQSMARENIAAALSQKLSTGWSLQAAKDTAVRLLITNPQEILSMG